MEGQDIPSSIKRNINNSKAGFQATRRSTVAASFQKGIAITKYTSIIKWSTVQLVQIPIQ